MKCFTRVRILAGSNNQTAAVFDKRTEGMKKRLRSSCYIAAEMKDDLHDASEVWFCRVHSIISFDLGDFEVNGDMIEGKSHELVVMEWAQKLQKGRQGQIYSNGPMKDVFTKPTAEDLCVVKRLVKVLKHRVPTRVGSHVNVSTTTRATKTRTYFLDDAIRVDNLLTIKRSTDGVIRILKGLTS